ncbi:IS1595 family transposase [uncultured Alistipes sp.]|uniref:IS1595 family transposase n=1 Tax=uncultured Alistipes sp. TaxID=538949 RepID=UPI002623380F|nr:IS1595 family transposase [uncultured Alistipes sp.]
MASGMTYPTESFFNLMKSLPDNRSCREFLEKYRWNGMPKCPHCDHQSDKHYRLKIGGVFNGLYKCRHCGKRFTVTVGTMFEGSKAPLDKWFYAIYQFLARKKGISSLQLSRDIAVTQKTAWFMLDRIRHNLDETGNFLSDKFDGVVQVDETFIGGKNKGRFKFNRGRSTKQKTPVVGLLTDDRVYAIAVKDTGSRTLKTIIYGLVKRGATVVTDEWPAYKGISIEYTHEVVTHHTKHYVNERGYHTNGIEGFWSHLKRGLKGIYHVVRPKYLQLYCNEFAYRYNTRHLTDMQRFIQFLMRPTERLRYSELCRGYS